MLMNWSGSKVHHKKTHGREQKLPHKQPNKDTD